MCKPLLGSIRKTLTHEEAVGSLYHVVEVETSVGTEVWHHFLIHFPRHIFDAENKNRVESGEESRKSPDMSQRDLIICHYNKMINVVY